jgi:hypothetical protein
MYAFLSRSSRPRASAPARARKRRPSLESLEGRQLMSLGPEAILPVNTTTRNAQLYADTASAANGSSVTVWVDTYSPTDRDIRGQRFDAAGNKVGPEFIVTFSSLDETEPAVAMDARGDFVVTWTQKQTNGDTNVVAQRFDAAANKLGAVLPIGSGTFAEHQSDVAMDAQGRFTVAYVRDTNNNNPDVFAKQYDALGNFLNVVNVATTGRAELTPKIAMTPDGRFDVAWDQEFSSTDRDIWMNAYSSTGTIIHSFPIAVSAINEVTPSIAMDDAGNAAMAWAVAGNGIGDIKARRVSVNGVMGPVFTIADTSDNEETPAVAMKHGGGSFAVAYSSSAGTRLQIFVAEVSASNGVTLQDAGQPRFLPSISIDGSDNYMVVYTALRGQDYNIHSRRGHLD